MDSAPEWVGRQHPDSLFVSSNGQAIRPESSPGYCLDHPGVRKADLAFYEAVARRAGASPAFLGFDLWSEPHVINWANPTYIQNPEFCFCRNTVARFREWLKKKYGTLDALNARVVPPLRVLGRGRAEPAQHDPLVHRLHRLEAVHRRQARGGPARAVRGGEARRPRSRGDEPRRGRGALLLAALLGGPVGRLDDGRAGRLLRDVLLPEALGLRGPRRRVAGGAARLRALVRLRERGARLLDRRAAGRLRHDRAERQPDRDAGGPAGLDVERARARGEGDLHLRVLPDEHRLRVGRLRAHPARRDAHRARAAWPGGIARLVGEHSALFLGARPLRVARWRSSTTRSPTSSAAGSGRPPTAGRRARWPASSATRCSASTARSSRRTCRSTSCTPTT